MFTREQLIKNRHSSTTPIPRTIRKRLIKYKIWCPRSARPEYLNLNKNSIISRDTTNGSRCGLLNSRSINGKEASIYELICDNDLDILALTETWCNEKSNVSLGLITPPGYQIHQTPRTTRGGGVGLIFRETYRAKLVNHGSYSALECQTTVLTCDTQTLSVSCIYLPNGFNGHVE